MEDKEKMLSFLRGELARANDIPWPEDGCARAEEDWYFGMQIYQRIKSGLDIAEFHFREEWFLHWPREAALEDQLLFGREDWRPSQKAVLALLCGGLVTVGDLAKAPWGSLKKQGLEDPVGEELAGFLRSVGYDIRYPRSRRP